ncbi:hypothetical protein Lesp02_04920 [Lentzea sp. NBRC 105346]|uniref:hypothetical protein n=1 Tax=Lentzea sp. NBRC 105346 TaxID=3032205 RepID=UPI0024A42664|nr:hypothetical protein [Lentzea sp. NBRC 105346]GLZ28302.1 hypothetical protein Lesp02_04920 [Lentzea sp. NBRC 105346]
MTTSRKLGATVALGLLALSLSTTSASAEPYVFELEKAPDGSIGYPADINDHDVIVGRTADRAVKWYANGSAVDLGTFDADLNANARAINNNGVVVGQSGIRAVRWNTNGDIDWLPGPAKQCAANDINDSGVIVGTCDDSYNSFAVRWNTDGSRPSLLPPLPDDTRAGATGVNAEGLVVGWSANAAGERHAVAWSNGTTVRLGTGVSAANKVNDRGDISVTLDGHAVRWNLYTGTSTVLDTRSSSAEGINEYGVVVGSVARYGTTQAVRWEDGQATALPPLLIDGSVNVASAVNSSNNVVGVSHGRGVRWRG